VEKSGTGQSSAARRNGLSTIAAVRRKGCLNNSLIGRQIWMAES
jgi:hypothetical protein